MSFSKDELKYLNKVVALIENRDFDTAKDFLSVINKDVKAKVTAQEEHLQEDDLEEYYQDLEDADDYYDQLSHDSCRKHGKKSKGPNVDVDVEVEIEASEDGEVIVLDPLIEKADDDLKKKEHLVETADEEVSVVDYMTAIVDAYSDSAAVKQVKDYANSQASLQFTVATKTDAKVVVDFIYSAKTDVTNYAYNAVGSFTYTETSTVYDSVINISDNDPYIANNKEFNFTAKHTNAGSKEYKEFLDYSSDPKGYNPDLKDVSSFIVSMSAVSYFEEVDAYASSFCKQLTKLKNVPEYPDNNGWSGSVLGDVSFE